MQSQEDIERLNKLFRILCSMLGFGKDVVEAMMTRFERDYQEERGLRAIMDFIGHGGKVEQAVISEAQAELFRQRLQERHVTYHEEIITRDDNTKQHMFMYRGVTVHNGKELPTPDKLQVEQIKRLFELELSCNSKELDMHTFKQLMSRKEIGIADHLSLGQVYAFRQNVKDTDIKFCVLQDTDQSYKIYADNKDKLTNVLVRMSYDLANDTTGEFSQAAAMYAQKRDALYDRLGKDEFIICDKNDPNNFIHVGKHSYSIHSFQKQPELQPDGTTKDVIRDVARPQQFKMDKEQLLGYVKQVANPIAVSVADFTLLSSINKSGRAFANPDIAVNYLAFKEQHKDDDLVLNKYPRKKPRYREQDLDGYVHLPMSMVQQIKHDLPFVHTNDVDSIAFDKSRKPEVDKYLQENIFDKISDPLQEMAFRWKIEGRSGNMNLQLNGDIKEQLAIINPDDTKFMIGLDKEGAHIYQDGKETAMCPADSEEYAGFLQQYINVIPNPVVLSQEEMESEDANRLISDRANGFCENEVILEMVNLEETEKKELIEHMDHADEMELSPEQEKAVNEVKKLHVHSKELDRAIFAEMQDLAANKEVTKDEEIDL